MPARSICVLLLQTREVFYLSVAVSLSVYHGIFICITAREGRMAADSDPFGVAAISNVSSVHVLVSVRSRNHNRMLSGCLPC